MERNYAEQNYTFDHFGQNYDSNYGIFLDCKNGRTYDEHTRSPNMNQCNKCCSNYKYYNRCYPGPERACEDYDVQRCPRGYPPASLATQYPYAPKIPHVKRVPYYFPPDMIKDEVLTRRAEMKHDEEDKKENFLSGSGIEEIKIDKEMLVMILFICVLYVLLTNNGNGNQQRSSGIDFGLVSLIDDRIRYKLA